ncbi:MAG: hypothetical protein LAP39_14335 [Acidobacteriia bacterium]|nr:hypothetical protein [Terriglobia bacterium]
MRGSLAQLSEMLPRKKAPRWMRYAGMVKSGNSRSSRSIDAVVYGGKPG